MVAPFSGVEISGSGHAAQIASSSWREMIEHADELPARAERQTDEVAIARLEDQVQGWREAAARLRARRT